MPYINTDDREPILTGNKLVETAGELNFVITTLIKDHLDRKGLSYTEINTLIGVLECAKLELYRRVATPYEDKKIQENGDVY